LRDCYIHFYTHCQELKKSLGGHGTAIHDDGDGVILLNDTHEGYDHTHYCFVCFGFDGTDATVTVKVLLLWSFHCKLLDMLPPFI
jgi:hypothetical protein